MAPNTVSAIGPHDVKNHRYALLLAVLFGILWAGLAIKPLDRADWAVENILVLICVVLFALAFRRFSLSRLSYTLIFVFMCLHEIGAHYTYSEVPYDEWFKSLSGVTFNSLLCWERNNFDRVTHFFYGLLLAYPVHEVLTRFTMLRSIWCYLLPLDLAMSTSALYELFEWAAAEILAGDLGQAYLGTQGDVWDAHKDIALASLGAPIAMLITFAINRMIDKKKSA